MNWIRREKRLAIYLRDGLACMWCGLGIEDGAHLTLDHLKAYTHGGSNDARNLVTSCGRCNASKGARTPKVFAAAVASYLNHTRRAKAILLRIERNRRADIDVAGALKLMAQRGGFTNALSTLRKAA